MGMSSGWLVQSDIEALIGTVRLIELTDDEAAGEINQTVLDAVLSRAMAEAEAALSHYQIPASSPYSPFMVGLGAELALKILHERRPQSATFYKETYGDALAKRIESLEKGDAVAAGMDLKTLGMAVASVSPGHLTHYGPDSTGTMQIDGF